MWQTRGTYWGGGKPFFEVSLGGGEEVFDVGLGGAKWFLTEQLRLYGKCREMDFQCRGAKRFLAGYHNLYIECRKEVSEVVNLYFWPS